MTHRAEYDDLFIFAPSCLLDEGKALGTAKVQDVALIQDLHKMKDADPAAFAKKRKVGVRVGRRKLLKVQEKVRIRLMQHIDRYYAGTWTEKKFRTEAVRLMKGAWKDVFLAGLRAGGTQGQGPGKGKSLVKLDAGDDKWVKSAMTHEMRFLNGFLKAIIDESFKMPLPRRVEMYVRALTSFYESSRVIALPFNTIIHWTGPNNKITCPSCRFMFENSPYTKLTLPTTPRSGLTICLTNCRDRLTIRRVDPAEAVKITEKGKGATYYVRRLRQIKKRGY